MKKSSLALLALLLLAPGAFAKQKSFIEPRRTLANEGKLVFSKLSPDLQSINGAEAFAVYESLGKVARKLGATDEKNYAEFALLEKSLEARGYEIRLQPLSGKVFGHARLMEFYRKDEMGMGAADGEEAYTSVRVEYYYTQLYLAKGVKPDGSTPVPSVKLHGQIFLRCPSNPKDDCPVQAITINEAIIEWDLLKSARGANSSAGGANQK